MYPSTFDISASSSDLERFIPAFGSTTAKDEGKFASPRGEKHPALDEYRITSIRLTTVKLRW
jgi:hypothetical protein